MFRTLLVLSLFAIGFNAHALDLSDISSTEATGGLRDALTQAAGTAVGNLGKADGFLGNPKVKIPLPDNLRKAEKLMRLAGMGDQADELVTSMNRAAEAAVPEAKALLVESVRNISVEYAKAVLTGGDNAATKYFKKTTSKPLAEKFLPIVQKATEKVALAQQYNKFAGAAASYGLVKKDQTTLEQYVTQKALDGLYTMMAEEEKAIRKNPVGATSSLVKKVFGAMAGN